MRNVLLPAAFPPNGQCVRVRHPRMWDFSVAHEKWMDLNAMPSIHIFGALVLHLAAEDEVRALPPSLVTDQIQRRQHRQNSEVGVGEREKGSALSSI